MHLRLASLAAAALGIAFCASSADALSYIKSEQRVVAVSANNANEGATGWMQFCPKATDPVSLLSQREPDDDCVSIRPMAFAERDSAGAIVKGLSHRTQTIEQRYRTELYRDMAVGEAKEIILPACDLKMPNNVLCGNGANNSRVRALSLPITVHLDTVAKGTMSLDALVFLDYGIFSFDGLTFPVAPGTSKIDFRIDGYEFAEAGASLLVRFVVASSKRRPEYVTVDKNSTGFGLLNGNDIELSPRYSTAMSSNGTLYWHSSSVGRSVVNGIAYVEMNFNGPFTHMKFDTFVNQGKELQKAGTPDPSAIIYHLSGDSYAHESAAFAPGVSGAAMALVVGSVAAAVLGFAL